MAGGAVVSESVVLADVKLALGALPDLTIWRCNTGAGRMESGQWVEFGTPGQADVQGILAVQVPIVGIGSVLIGRFFAIETKASHGPKCKCKSCILQRAWGAMVKRRGGIYGVARSGPEALEVYRRAKAWEL
jgi:hypothetical protein